MEDMRLWMNGGYPYVKIVPIHANWTREVDFDW